MTVTTTRTPESARLDPSEQNLRTAAETLLHAMIEAGLDDPRWESAGPLVSMAAERLREALGTPVHGRCVAAPTVVREADFALAVRPLLAEVVVMDPDAAEQFVRVAVEAALALR